MKDTKTHDIVVWGAAIIAFISGMGLCITGFYVQPTGEIDGSVLTATGEFLTFFGSVFGIGQFTRIKIEQIKSTEVSKNE